MLGGDHATVWPSMVKGGALDGSIVHSWSFAQAIGAWSSATWTTLELSLLGLDLERWSSTRGSAWLSKGMHGWRGRAHAQLDP